MDISFPPAFGSLLLSTGAWDEQAMGNVDMVRSNEPATVEQVIRVSPDAPSYSHVDLRLDLYISAPNDTSTSSDSETPPELQFIQQHDLRVQISAHYVPSETADFLLITNSTTTNERVQAIRNFIESDLMMGVDEWNIGLYGGLQYRIEEGESVPSSVLSTYEGKTIIFLGNEFEFFQSGSRSIFQLCDLEPLANATLKGTSCLFLSSAAGRAHHNWFQNVLFPVLQEHGSISMTGSSTYDTVKEMATSMVQNKALGKPSLGVYTTDVSSKWYRLGI